MPHKLLLSFWTIVTLFTLVVDGNAQETLERTINHPTFAFPTSVARYKN